MGIFKPATGVIFAEKDLEIAFESLAENSPLKKSIKRAIDNINKNVFCGDQIPKSLIPKSLIPKEYIKKYRINNLWWYPLADNWRLVYSIVTPSKVEIVGVIIEYYNHKAYERRFGY